jgi:hypothetical protein
MVVRYSGGNFNRLLIDNKKFVWFVYDEIQLDKTSKLSLLPTWIKPDGIIANIIDNFPNIIFVESIFNEVNDDLYGLGYNLDDDVEHIGLWDSHNEHQKPAIIGFDKGWKKVDSVGKCYCLETLSDIMFEIYPEELQNYLNQPV